MIYVAPRLFITVHCSGPLFIVPRTTASLFTKFSKILWCMSIAKKTNVKILEYFEFATEQWPNG